jgi:hypothetical protein
VRFADLAAHVFFTETGEPIPKRPNGKNPSPLGGMPAGSWGFVFAAVGEIVSKRRGLAASPKGRAVFDACWSCGNPAGFAMGLGIPVIWTVREDQIGQVHFDTRQYNHIVYDSAEDLRKKLHNRIAATIR